MRVGLFTYPRLVHAGGFERYIITLANYLAARGHNVSIISSNSSEYRLLSIALNIYYRNQLFYNSDRLSIDQILSLISPSVRLIETHFWNMPKILSSFDIIYSKNELLELGLIYILRRAFSADLPPIVVGIHTPIHYPVTKSINSKIHNYIYLSNIYLSLLDNISAIHVSNKSDKLLLTSKFPNLKKTIYYIPYPFNVAQNDNAVKKKDDKKFSLLFVGRLTEQKGVDILLDCINASYKEASLREIRWTIVGSGEPRYEASIRRLAAQTKNVRYLGYVSPENMYQVYAQHHCVLVPSRWEVLPYVCLEAQAFGIPVVASNIPGPADIIIHGQTGLLVEPTANHFIDGIRILKRMWEHEPAQFRRMGEIAQSTVKSLFSPTVIFPRLESMLVEVTIAKINRKH
jgi:glycosyltransferase involved in cell wall biosynthesis